MKWDHFTSPKPSDRLSFSTEFIVLTRATEKKHGLSFLDSLLNMNTTRRIQFRWNRRPLGVFGVDLIPPLARLLFFGGWVGCGWGFCVVWSPSLPTLVDEASEPKTAISDDVEFLGVDLLRIPTVIARKHRSTRWGSLSFISRRVLPRSHERNPGEIGGTDGGMMSVSLYSALPIPICSNPCTALYRCLSSPQANLPHPPPPPELLPINLKGTIGDSYWLILPRSANHLLWIESIWSFHISERRYNSAS